MHESVARGEAGVIPLDGRLERTSARPIVMAVVALATAFFLFQVVISPITLVVVLIAQGVSMAELAADFEGVLAENWRAMLIANTSGQFFGIALVAYLFARLHSSRPWAYMRVRRSDATAMALAVVGIIGLIPLTQWLGAINEMIPLPEWLEHLEQAQTELIEQALMGREGILFNLFVLALTPALCEELLFRGYVQRQAERSIGYTGGILFSGIVFGLYHLRISHVVPLTLVGLYLGYVAWQFRSIWPAVLGHLVFNGFAVVAGAFSRESTGANVDEVEITGVPWYLLLGGLVILGASVAAMHRRGAIEDRLATPEAIGERNE